MKCDDVIDRIDAWAAGELADADAAAVERHVDGCADCREQARVARSLAVSAGRLPREMAPARDLWPGIRADIEANAGSSWGDWTGRIAAVLVIGLASLLAYRMDPVQTGDPVRASNGYSSGMQSPWRYALERTHLPDAEREALAADMRRQDRAVERLTAALTEHPENRNLQSLYHAAYRDRMAMTRKIAELAHKYPNGSGES